MSLTSVGGGHGLGEDAVSDGGQHAEGKHQRCCNDAVVPHRPHQGLRDSTQQTTDHQRAQMVTLWQETTWRKIMSQTQDLGKWWEPQMIPGGTALAIVGSFTACHLSAVNYSKHAEQKIPYNLAARFPGTAVGIFSIWELVTSLPPVSCLVSNSPGNVEQQMYVVYFRKLPLLIQNSLEKAFWFIIINN